ncbi:hypothetical protein COCC4DRAFT_34463 [Bipolaris maydis ATCC 48331]|uniref:Uncharacterized protein n=2 Tax=Cochliobolus heterostrophus TaxID=5016 RepID=M2UZH6_COCH5|nr:uncharacterized protein COCC4DRAFT_34463 [Bipolaris maydis ATCC 48331]EMD93127.1 hypothetical protein COCHEDRAFT_1020898 [Bipolaris maydis C5]ENI00279.1 hypothetical protein COCC4DRAFT_34463 [Bipolaris maydis ATCC 48331]
MVPVTWQENCCNFYSWVDLYSLCADDRTMVEFEEPGLVRRKIGRQGIDRDTNRELWGGVLSLRILDTSQSRSSTRTPNSHDS